MSIDPLLRTTPTVIVFAAMVTISGYGCTTTNPPASVDSGFDIGRADAGHDASFDSGSDSSLEDSGPDGDAFTPGPHRCPDEAIPGFQALDGGWFRPCNCFDGDPLRPVPTDVDEGLRTVPFDCAWPANTIYHRTSYTTQPAEIDAFACAYTSDAIRSAGFFPAPFEETFFAVQSHLPEGVPNDRICVPSECVFDTPGQPARCSEECAPFSPTTYLTTMYRVDRTACDVLDGGIPDSGGGGT